jgi:hypothetical protein
MNFKISKIVIYQIINSKFLPIEEVFFHFVNLIIMKNIENF